MFPGILIYFERFQKVAENLVVDRPRRIGIRRILSQIEIFPYVFLIADPRVPATVVEAQPSSRSGRYSKQEMMDEVRWNVLLILAFRIGSPVQFRQLRGIMTVR